MPSTRPTCGSSRNFQTMPTTASEEMNGKKNAARSSEVNQVVRRSASASTSPSTTWPRHEKTVYETVTLSAFQNRWSCSIVE